MNHVRKMVTDNIIWLQMVSEGYDKAQKKTPNIGVSYQ